MSVLIGDPVIDRYAANPGAVIEPGFSVHLLTQSARRPSLGTGDMRAPIDRPGSDRALTFPSRVGERLYWPDGRVTHLNGDPS